MLVTSFPYHHLSEKIIDLVCTQVQNQDRMFFRIETAYYLCKLASNMHVSVQTITNNKMPVNAFAIAFAESGYGKNYSQNIMENEIFCDFEEEFVHSTYPNRAKKSITDLAMEIAAKTGEDSSDVEAELLTDFTQNGHFLYAFPEGTSPALKQLCKSINLARCGAASLEMDEIGSNLTNNGEIIATFLELYDVGFTKDKLIKATKENKRARPVKGYTPANVFAFGTPVNVFDGGKVEEIFLNWLKTGYGRRCFFAYGDLNLKNVNKKTRDEIFKTLTDKNTQNEVMAIRKHFKRLADIALVGKTIYVGEDAEKFRMDYQDFCKTRAEMISEYRPIERTEMTHRHVKALKLAAAYAFCDGKNEVSILHLQNAIAIAERSGESLYKILNQPRAHIRLANFLADFGTPVTEADLVEYLPFYSGSVSSKKDLINLAMSYGYKNALAITAYKEANVMFYKGTKLEENDLSKAILSTSTEFADKYTNNTPPFHKLPAFFASKTGNFCNHHFENGEVGNGRRTRDTTIAGANMVVFDVDQTKIKPEFLSKILGEYNHIIYTTKSHTEQDPRYRLILPLSHKVTLEEDQYRALCKNIAYWLPVTVDIPAIQRERKYRYYAGSKVFSKLDGINLGVMPYYPNTQRSEELETTKGKMVSVGGMKRWVVRTATEGNRNQTLYRYAAFLAEQKVGIDKIEAAVIEVNELLDDPLSSKELEETILKSIKGKK